MKNRNNGFTLIEMLAVIVIIGILVLVSIPAVTHQIDQSRKKTYIDIASEYIEMAATEAAKGTFPIRRTDTTYYIHINNLHTESKRDKSPYAAWVDAYVVVNLSSDNDYEYYWVSVDETGHRIDVTKEPDLRESSVIESTKRTIDIKPIDGRLYVTCWDRTGNRVNS